MQTTSIKRHKMYTEIDGPKKNGASKRNSTWTAIKKNKNAYFLFLPALSLIVLVLAYPIVYTFYLSTDSITNLKPFVQTIRNPMFIQSLGKSGIFVAGTIFLHLLIGLILALLINTKVPVKGLFQVIILLPWVLNDVTVSILWKWMVNPQVGFLNISLQKLGLPQYSWLSSPTLAMLIVIIANTWKGVAFAFIFILAGLRSIPQPLYESARIDGASGWQALTKITLPLLTPVLLILTIIFSIGTFNLINIILIMTGGGPFNSTNVVALYMYKTAFEFLNFSSGARIAIFLLIINLVLTVTYFQALKKSSSIYQ